MDASDSSGSGGPDTLRLKVASGNAAGTVIQVEDELVIGRQAAGPGTLGNDIEISRRHARISCGPEGRYIIEDLGSTNGTYVNGRAVEGPVTLETGDRIELGASALVVQVSAPPATPPSTPVTTTSALAGAEADGPQLADHDAADAPLPAEPAEPAEPQIDPADGGVDVAVEAAGLPPLSLKIDVDLEAGVITVALDGEDADPVRFVHDGGSWRVA